MRAIAISLVLLFVVTCDAQYPRTRAFDLRLGGERPDATQLLVDRQGLLWVGGRSGLFLTDGAYTRRMLPLGRGEVVALGVHGTAIAAALSDGSILHITGTEARVIHQDSSWSGDRVCALAGASGDVLWVGTRSSGLWRIGPQGVQHFTMASGLPDDHVNALLVVGDILLVATDAGIAMLDTQGVMLGTLDGSVGAPDNLVLALALDKEGGVWAGTDRGSCFRFKPGPARTVVDTVLDDRAGHPVVGLVWSDARLWVATRNGVRVHDLEEQAGLYLPPPDRGGMSNITSIVAGADGAVWWCGGTSRVLRGDGRVLIVPGHEGVDLRDVSALCLDRSGRIHLAVGDVIHSHATAFAEQERMTTTRLDLPPRMRIAALHADGHGDLWVGTMGLGLYRLREGRPITHWTERDGLANDHILGISSDDQRTWLATLAGVGVVRSRDPGAPMARVPVPGSGFLFGIVADQQGGAYAASDGNGLLRIPQEGPATSIPVEADGRGSLHVLARDAAGRIWAGGPGTGSLRLDDGSLVKLASPGTMGDDVTGIAPLPNGVIVFANGSVWLGDPDRSQWLDMGALLGHEERLVTLTALDHDAQGEVWAATDMGVLRLGPGLERLLDPVKASILGWRSGEDALPWTTGGDTPALHPEQNHVTFQLAAPALGMPEVLRFQYRLVGHDSAIRVTREREVAYARLPSGPYRFEVRAFLEGSPPGGEWTTLPFRIMAPWWRRGWAMALWVLLLSLGLYTFVRAREKRLRLRDQLEREKVKYQLDALRSQVNPHFLFNSFNVLIELIEQDRGKAVEQVQDLSAFFRDMLRVRDQELIPVREELHMVRHYFALEQRRFGARIELSIRVGERALDLEIPPLTLQLLVENAIKHNVATDADPLVITIKDEADELVVTNPLRPRANAPVSTAFGLDSIRKRCLALAGRAMSVNTEGGTFQVRIPLVVP